MTNEQKKQILLDLIKIEEKADIFYLTREDRAEFQIWVEDLVEPRESKEVYAENEKAGEIEILTKEAYSDLCLRAAQAEELKRRAYKTVDSIEKDRIKTVMQISNPAIRAMISAIYKYIEWIVRKEMGIEHTEGKTE